jgi:hypothetical protein
MAETPPGVDLDRVVLNDFGDSITVRELRARVEVLEPNIVSMQDLDGPTPATLTVMTERVMELSADMPRFGVLVDLSRAARRAPSKEYRKFIPTCWTQLHADSKGRLAIVAVAFTGSQVARVMTKFLIGRMTSVPFTMERSVEDAVRAIRSVLTASA